MSGNTFGTLFTITSFGESHGAAIGCIVDGCPPGLTISTEEIQLELDRRKPGTSRHVTQRRESDTVEILSGVFEGQTTGTPIALLIRNEDQRSKDYSKIMDTFRPAMRTIPTGKNTVSAIIVGVAVHRRVRLQYVLQPVRLQKNGCTRNIVL